MEKAEHAAKALEKREEEFNRNIDPSLQSGNTIQSGLASSPVYIIADNMIGNISSEISIVPINPSLADRLASLRNNGLNADVHKNGSKSLAEDTQFHSNVRPSTSPILSMPVPVPTPPLPVSGNSSIENKSLSPSTTSSSTGSNLQQIDPLANYKTSNLINAGDLFKLFNQTDPSIPKILILDVRHRNEFDAGHIKTNDIVCLEPLVLQEGLVGFNEFNFFVLFYYPLLK